MEKRACWCALPSITGSSDCCKNCQEYRLSRSTTSTSFTMPLPQKLCSSCKHYFCLVNQGIWGCNKNHLDVDAANCDDYEESPGYYTITTTKI